MVLQARAGSDRRRDCASEEQYTYLKMIGGHAPDCGEHAQNISGTRPHENGNDGVRELGTDGEITSPSAGRHSFISQPCMLLLSG